MSMTTPARLLSRHLAAIGLGLVLVAAAPAASRLTVRERLVPDTKVVAATIATKDMAEARARIGGTLVRRLVDEGQRVRRGQLLAVVVDDRLTFETRAYDAQVAAAEAQYANARAEYDRVKPLYEKGWYAKARLDQAEAAAKAAAGALEAARAQKAAAAELGDQGKVFAPEAGLVTAAPVPLGSVVTAGQSIAAIAVDRTVLRIDMPERQAGALKVGLEVGILNGAAAGAVRTGTIEQVYPSVASGRVMADVAVPGLRNDRMGARVRVAVPLGQRKAIVVPRGYVVTRFGVDYVKLLVKSGKTLDVPVQRGAAMTAPGITDGIELLSGVRAGDVLVRP
ncbi:efflux RND transporter periplasmic adaptor subunit [Parapedomonas caeni]